MGGLVRLLVAIMLVGACAFVFTREEEPDRDLWDLQTPSAKAAVLRFQKADEAANADYQRRLAEARKALLSDLEGALKEATRAAKLEEANRIDAARKKISELDASAWPSSGRQVVLHYAAFGAYDKWKDVTPKVRDLLEEKKNKALTIVPSTQLFGDPAFGHWKSLVVVYSFDRKLNVAIGPMDKPLTIPSKSAP